jgi:hypothetical protein
MFNREQDAEIAKIDYMVRSMAVITGIPQKQFESKIKALNAYKEATEAILFQDVYNPAFRKAKQATAVDTAKRDAELLQTVKNLGKKE